jgi:putative ABC transport system ATP-binding protein
MLSLRQINLTLGKNTKLQRKVLNDLDLEVKPGEFNIIVGGNGAGKSSLFNVIAGYMQPDAGQILFAQQDVTNASQRKRAPIIAKVMQDPRIGTIENMTILENLAFAYKRGAKRSLLPFANARRRKYFQQQLARLNMGLENRLDELVINLSGGQRQALSLIMAIIADCKILLLDEITAALDPTMAQQVMQIANAIVREQGYTCLMITHNMQHAIEYGDNILVLKDGKFVRKFDAQQKRQLTTHELAASLHN